MPSTMLRGNSPKDEILTVREVADELRCSKAHVHNAINGKVSGGSPLPASLAEEVEYILK